jgi:tetratricopeptide (TPR) repeat protein
MLPRTGAALALAAALFAANSTAAPEVLIVQRLKQGQGLFNVPIGQQLAKELDEEGRVFPILWSMTDPVFRAYVDDGKLPSFIENPDDKTIRDVVGRLKVAYVLVVEAVAENSQVVPQANLYMGTRTRPVWSMVREDNRGRPRLVVIDDGKVDEEKTKEIREKYADIIGDGTLNTMTVLVNGQPDWDSTAITLARTWTRILAEGPFRDLEPQRRTFNPNPDPGLTFAGGGGPAKAPDSELALEQARMLAADGDTDAAILVLRDAIDADPFGAACRLKLALLLIQRGHPETAAIECERAAKVTDRPGAMWELAADAWIQAGDTDKALNAASEAQARGVNSPELLQSLGDIWLIRAEPDKALKFYNDAIVKSPTERSYLGRALARALAGDTAGCVKDLEKAQGEASLPLGLYQRAMGVLDQEISVIAEQLRTIPMGVRVQDGPDMLPAATALQARAAALVEFMVRIRVPERHVESHKTRDLAYKLLSQSSVEVLVYARTKNEDASLEAAISLGEALKLVSRINETFQFERKYGQKAPAN